MKVDAVLPAAGRIHGEFAQEAGTDIKAMISFAGSSLLERTLNTLRASGSIGRIVVVEPEELNGYSECNIADMLLPEGGDSGPENIVKGLEWLGKADGKHASRVLIVTTDLPFLSTDAVNTYIDQCDHSADVCAPLVSQQAFENAFPGSINKYVPMADGNWTMGCAFLVDPEAIIRCKSLLVRAFHARKSQFAMAGMLGFGFTLRFLLRRVTVVDIEKRFSEIICCTTRAVHNSSPTLAFDIDNVEDYRYTLQKLQGKQNS